ncbi:HNH endonuclease signature motif containing protein [Actinomadura sp. KC345]|uniref:HNH endonuclease signature motif containing protein n=1 Tax=Actinomadura sp. KC345 TaxID=2530371 RepID=UPI00140512D7|nr:HNH endonuclease signature motif containing protein [Actinomadura sp. KC345]
MAAAARRQTSWAQARELAAIAELTARRTAAEEADDHDYRILPAREAVTEEVAAALTVTGNTAATLVHLAEQLTGPLSRTGDALETGRIDMARARVICDVTDALPEQVTRRVEAAALEKASDQTTGQLRRRIKRIAQRLAPEAVEERRREAVRQRRLELWDNPSGTADLALCDLAAEDAHGIHNKITAAAHGLKADGDTRPIHVIRADLATQLLNGAPLPDAVHAVLAQAGATDQQNGGTLDLRDSAAAPRMAGIESSGAPRPNGAGPPTPAATAADPAGDAGSPNEDPAIPELAAMMARRLTHLRDRTPAAELPTAVNHAVQRTAARLARQRDALCQGDDDRHGRPGHRPPASMRREIEGRHATCVFPTCNQPSHRCDLDHTVPWRPGITCRCNLAPLCRRHHRLKQSPDWNLHHIWPGLLLWTTPAGAWYIVRPDRE